MARARGDQTAEAADTSLPAVIETDFKPIDWKKILFSPKYIPWHLMGIFLLVITILMMVYHDKVVHVLRPISEKLRDIPAGWLIPIVILFIISFPPLFGHEIVALLCGVVWGLWLGFAIVAAGTFVGEVGTWFAFKHLFRNRSQRMERSNLNYASLARLTREGGFWIVLIIRLSIIPSHFSTAVFSACDVKFWHFCVATFLSLPKQVILVYLGVLLIEAEDANPNKSPESRVQTALFIVASVVTILLGFYISYKMRFFKKQLIAAQDERRAAKGAAIEMQDLTSVEHVQDEEGAGFVQNAEGEMYAERDDERFARQRRHAPGHHNEYTYADVGQTHMTGAYNGLGLGAASRSEENISAMPAQQPTRWL